MNICINLNLKPFMIKEGLPFITYISIYLWSYKVLYLFTIPLLATNIYELHIMKQENLTKTVYSKTKNK